MNSIEEARHAANSACNLVVFSGAGLSAESGLATFRDKGEGLWSKYDPMELASVDGFDRDPELVLRWYEWRRQRHRSATPNAAHRAIARSGARNVTQNVDNLLERAGVVPEQISHLHGSIMSDRCHAECGWRCDIDLEECQVLRACPSCGARTRPSIVWFGESLPEDALTRAIEWCGEADCLLVVGTSGVVQPAASLVGMAKARGTVVIDVNPDANEHTGLADILVSATAANAIPEILSGIEKAPPK